MAIIINLINRNRKRKINPRKIRRIAKAVFNHFGLTDAEVNIEFVSSQKIRYFNKRYLNKNKATDVIAFEDKEKRAGKKFFGDIVVSTDRANRNSKIYNTSFMKEVELYVIHGLLHLKGFEDITAKGRETMRRMEDGLLQKNKRYL